jgi:menaquinone-9 beta-reductase
MPSVRPRMTRYDVVIVGARCAGAATALLLAREGLRVLLVERGQYGTDTLSTHALMRGGVLQLHKWGLLQAIRDLGTPPIRRATFSYNGDELSVPIKPRDGVDALYAPRRTVVDRVLVDAAARAGVEVSFGLRLVDVERAINGRVTGVVVHDEDHETAVVGAPLVIGADGLRSTLARLVGAETYRRGTHSGAVVYGYWSGLPVSGYRWSYGPGVAVGAIPTNDGQTCVFAATSSSRFAEVFRSDVAAGYHHVLVEAAPEIAADLPGARLEGSLHGFPGEVGFFRRSWGPGWALVGDAGYFKDPITAHGITDALRDAEILAGEVVRHWDGARSEYEARRDELASPLFEITDRIASFAWTLDEVRAEHEKLSEAMTREARALAGHPATALARA